MMVVTRGGDQFPEQTRNGSAVWAEDLLTQPSACTKRGETGQAEKLVRQALARDPHRAGALYELGRISYRAGDKNAAADCLRKAIASQPDNGKFHNELEAGSRIRLSVQHNRRTLLIWHLRDSA